MCHSSTSSSDPGRIEDQPSGLVTRREDLPSGVGGTTAVALVLLCFAVTLAGTGIVDRIAPVSRPQLLGAERDEYFALRKRAKVVDGSRAQLLELELRLSSRVRHVVGPPYAWVLYRWLGEVDSEAVVGRDGWLFLRDRLQPPAVPDAELVGRGAALVAALERRLGSLGVELAIVPVPRKAVLHRDKLPPRVDCRVQLDAALVDALREQGVLTVDLLPVLGPDSREPHYHRFGSHWTDAAQIKAAEAIARTLGLLVPEAERATRIVPGGERNVAGETELFRFIGADRVDASLVEPAAVPYRVELRDGSPVGSTAPTEMSRVAVVGTSFTAGLKLASFLAHFSNQRLWNAANAGVLPAQSLTRLLTAAAARRRPQLLILEVPNHQVFNRPFEALVGDFYTEVSPPSVRVLEPAPEVVTAPAAAPPVVLDESWVRIGSVAPGELGHTGNGVLALRLRGRATGDQVEVGLECGEGQLYPTPWPAARSQLVLPLLTAAPSSAGVEIHVRAAAPGRSSLALETVDLVLDVDGSDPEALVAECRRDAVAWRCDLAAAEAVRAAARSTLVVRAQARGAALGMLEIELRLEDGLWRTRAGPFGPTATMVVSLAPVRTRRLATVSVSADGDLARPPAVELFR